MKGDRKRKREETDREEKRQTDREREYLLQFILVEV